MNQSVEATREGASLKAKIELLTHQLIAATLNGRADIAVPVAKELRTARDEMLKLRIAYLAR